MTATKILFVIVLATIGIFLIVKGGITSLSQTKGGASEIEIKVLIGSFKIKSSNNGLIICFLGIILEVLVYYGIS